MGYKFVGPFLLYRSRLYNQGDFRKGSKKTIPEACPAGPSRQEQGCSSKRGVCCCGKCCNDPIGQTTTEGIRRDDQTTPIGTIPNLSYIDEDLYSISVDYDTEFCNDCKNIPRPVLCSGIDNWDYTHLIVSGDKAYCILFFHSHVVPFFLLLV